jgi:(p)ppGpp synthase/HD superfamily hydrolase
MAVIVKGVDRLNNISTMTGVFKPTKQRSYVGETKEWHLPMLKEARRKYPQYNAAFENIKYAIKSRIEMIELYLETIGNQNEAG